MTKPITFGTICCLCVLLCLMSGPQPAYAEGNGRLPRFEPTACFFPPPNDTHVECGYLIVPENRSQPTGRTIRISLTIAKSHNPAPAPDPLIAINGGPGGLVEETLTHLSRFDAVLAQRDLIFIEQRGIGWSKPVLSCPEINPLLREEKLGLEITPAAWVAAGLTCRDRWLDAGIDLTAYNSMEMAADVAAIWQALDYVQVNIYGLSYGTVVAQLVVRNHSDAGRIRSVILDAALPIDRSAKADVPARTAQAMANLFARCEANLLCRLAYPQAESRYQAVMASLQANPISLAGIDPQTGKPFTFNYDIDDFGYAILYNPQPHLLAHIFNLYDGDYATIIEAQEASVQKFRQRNLGHHFGLRQSIRCNEPWQMISTEQRTRMTIYPEAVFMNTPLDDALCVHWPVFTISPAPVVSDIPTLILTGEHDTRLVGYGALIAATLSRGYAYVIPGALHNVLETGGPCPNLMTLAFLADPTQPPGSDCLATTGNSAFDTQFVIRAAAARGPVRGLLSLLGLFLLGTVITIGRSFWRNRQAKPRFGFAWQHSLHFIGWRMIGLSIACVAAALYGAWTGVLPFGLSSVLAAILPTLMAVQTAFLLSPQDEPALEILLAAPRPLTWLLIERLGTWFGLFGIIGFISSIFVGLVTGEGVWHLVGQWLPATLFLNGIALYITLATRRAIFGFLIVSLLWFALVFFGDFLIERWPAAWPIHLYLRPTHTDYSLNRYFLSLIGLGLIGLASWRFLQNPEYLLLGHHRQNFLGLPVWRKLKASSNICPAASASLMTLLPAQEESRLPLKSPAHPRAISQILALIRYESLQHWRRVALPAVVLGLMITPLLGILIVQEDFQGYHVAIKTGSLARDVAKMEITAEMMPMIWMSAILIATVMIPLVVSETISKDQQHGMRELLDTLPLSPGSYLLGKLLGLWLNLIIGIVVAALTSGVAWWVFVGPFDIKLFVDVWLVGVISLSLIHAGTSLLLTAGQPTTRRALLIASLYVAVCLIGMGFLFTPEAGWWRYLNPARPPALLYYSFGFPGALNADSDLIRGVVTFVQQVARRQDVLISLGVGFTQVGLILGGCWLWMNRRLNH